MTATGGKFGDSMSPGNIMERLQRAESRIEMLTTARRLQGASVGQGGLRIRGGQLRIQDIAGDDLFRAGGDPGELFIREDILGPLALQVIAAQFSTDIVNAGENSTSSSISNFTDLNTVGPTVSVNVSESGRAVVFMSADINLSAIDGTASIDRSGYVGFEVSGATSISPSVTRAARLRLNFATHNGANAHEANLGGTASKIFLQEDLNEGANTFQLKYSATDTGFNVNFGARTLVVLGL